DHPKYNVFNIIAQLGKCAPQERSRQRQRAHPDERSSEVISDKLAKVKLYDTCEYRGKRTNNRNRTSDDQRRRAVLMVKLLGQDHVLALKHPGVLSLEQHGSGFLSKPVAGKVAQYASGEQAHAQGDDIHVEAAAGTEQSGQKKQVVARQEEPEE